MFTAPTADQLLALEINAGLPELALAPRFSAATADTVSAVVEGIAAFAEGEWAPLARRGDIDGARIHNCVVTLPDGYAEAYRGYVEQGWNSIAGPEDCGGQGLPWSLSIAVLETLGAADLGFTLLPILTAGAIDALDRHASAAQRALYLPKLVSGEWAGTMNLTESQAGSDVGALRTTATPVTEGPEAGLYRIKGTKIFITWGEHDLAANIVHLVLARLPGAPDGSRGISLFLVPKYRPDAAGNPGPRNDLRAVSIERKLGIHSSPTCVMSFGDEDSCYGELVGAPNEGLRAMFTMMNAARINVGAQGVEVAEAAWQRARAYARERIQSPRAGAASKAPVAIVEHPDVRRMLLRMRALTEAARALLYYTAGQVDRGTLGDAAAQARADVLVPLIKGWGTEVGCEVASLGIQVHGGTGFVEDTGAAQHYRDARILPIYEGTNGIQAADLVTRKLGLEQGEVLLALLADVRRDAAQEPALAALADQCAVLARWLRDDAAIDDRLAGAVPFLTMCAVAVAGWQLLRQAGAAAERGGPLAAAKAAVVRFFADHVVTAAQGLAPGVKAGAAQLYALDAEALTA